MAIFSGTTVGVFSLFVKPLQTEFGWGRGEVMLAFSLFFLVMGLSAPFTGKLIDRYGVRGIITGGSLAGGVSFVSLYFLQSIWHFYAAFTVIGVAMAALGQVPASAMVSNWFRKRRGTAIGVMSTGIGLGILVLVPIVGGYFIPHFGWRPSYLFLAAVVWILIPLALFVVRTKPAEMGLLPYGISSAEDMAAEVSSGSMGGLNLKKAMGTAAFWLISITFFVNGLSSMGVIQNQVPHLQDIGFRLVTASSALTALGIGSAVGKLFFGWLCDRIQPKYACAISLLLLAAGTLILVNVTPETASTVIWIYAIILGLGAGGWLPTMSMLINTNFGLTSYGVLFGMLTLVQSVGAAIGPPFAGFMFDTLGGYQSAFIILLALYAVALPTILAVRRPKEMTPSPGFTA
ncbi:MAG: MFS transporter [Dehalococcoidales bacterium]